MLWKHPRSRDRSTTKQHPHPHPSTCVVKRQNRKIEWLNLGSRRQLSWHRGTRESSSCRSDLISGTKELQAQVDETHREGELHHIKPTLRHHSLTQNIMSVRSPYGNPDCANSHACHCRWVPRSQTKDFCATFTRRPEIFRPPVQPTTTKNPVIRQISWNFRLNATS